MSLGILLQLPELLNITHDLILYPSVELQTGPTSLILNLRILDINLVASNAAVVRENGLSTEAKSAGPCLFDSLRVKRFLWSWGGKLNGRRAWSGWTTDRRRLILLAAEAQAESN
ncbi:MAG: hypothetical protein AABN95_13160 [Acidobacteriota bacterium]